MGNPLSPADAQRMVASFLEVAVGQTVDTAYQFLRAASWRIEDAMQLFYVGNEGRDANSPSCAPHVECTATFSDRNLSSCRLPLEMANASFTSPEMTSVASSSGAVSLSPGPAQTHVRRQRRTRAEMASAASALVIAEPSLLAPRRRRRTCAEMDAAALSSGVGILAPGSAHLVTRRPRRTRAQMTVAASLSGASLTPPHSAPITTRRPKRTRAQMAAAASSSGAALPTLHSAQLATRQPSQTRGQVPPDRGLLGVHSPILGCEPNVHDKGKRVCIQVDVDVPALCGPSLPVVPESHVCPQSRRDHIPLAIGTSSLRSVPLASGPPSLRSSRRNKTRIQINVDAHILRPSRRRKSCAELAPDPVYKALV